MRVVEVKALLGSDVHEVALRGLELDLDAPCAGRAPVLETGEQLGPELFLGVCEQSHVLEDDTPVAIHVGLNAV